MRKTPVIVIGTALVLALAAPALATHNVGGYFSTKFIMADFSLTDGGNKDPDKLIDQRLRIRWENSLNDYVSVVWHGEVDFYWGGQSKGEIGGGGQFGGDGVNVETKHAYATVKVPETPLAATLGLQAMWDNFGSLILDDDAAGIDLTMAMDQVRVSALYSKFSEGGTKSEDDVDLWALRLGFKPMADLDLGVEGYWQNDNLNGGNLYWVGVRGAYSMGVANLSGQVVYNFGKEDSQTDVTGYHAQVKAGFSVAGVDAGVRLFYFSGDNDAKDANYFHAISDFYGYDDGGMIFFWDEFEYSYGGSGQALNGAAHTDHGLWGASLSGKYVPPAAKEMYLRGFLGYFSAVEDKTKRIAETQGTSLGTEVALRAGYIIAERADVSLNAAYAFLGDFYDAPAGGKDPDNMYEIYAMLNVPY